MFQDVPGCSGMFRNVPECSGMFHVPGFIDARLAQFTLTVYAASLCTFAGFESMI